MTQINRSIICCSYVPSSDNKYVQYRLMSDTFNTTVANWQGVDDKPTTESKNLAESGGVFNELYKEVDLSSLLTIEAFISNTEAFGGVGALNSSVAPGDFLASTPIYVDKGDIIKYKSRSGSVCFILAFYSAETADETCFVSGIDSDYEHYLEGVFTAPANGYIRVSYEIQYASGCIFKLYQNKIGKNTESINDINKILYDDKNINSLLTINAFISVNDAFGGAGHLYTGLGDAFKTSEPIKVYAGDTLSYKAKNGAAAFVYALYSNAQADETCFVSGVAGEGPDVFVEGTITFNDTFYLRICCDSQFISVSSYNLLSGSLNNIYGELEEHSEDIDAIHKLLSTNILNYDYLMVIGSGQSLGAGWAHSVYTTIAKYASNELMWGNTHRTWNGERSTSDYENGLHPLKETAPNSGIGETSDSKAVETALGFLLNSRGLTSCPKFVVCNNAYGGYSLTQLKKGTEPYNEMIREITATKNFCNSIGKTFAVAAVTWMQGEAENDESNQYTLSIAQYKAELKKFIKDINDDVKAITEQIPDVKLFTYQTPTINTVTQLRKAQVAQYEASYEDANIILGAVISDSTFVDAYHIDLVSTMKTGVRFGFAMANAFIGGNYDCIRPLIAEVDGNDLYITFNTPKPPLTLTQITGVGNYGFKVLKNGTDILSSVTLYSDCVVKLACTETPIGSDLAYSINTGHSAGSSDALCGVGGLSDSMEEILNYDNNEIVVNNIAPSFQVAISSLKG